MGIVPIQPIVPMMHGPLPLPVGMNTFNSPFDGDALLLVSGSVFVSSTPGVAGVNVLIDGTSVGTASVYIDAAQSHRALVATLLPVTMTLGQHGIQLSALSGTATDRNDYFNISLVTTDADTPPFVWSVQGPAPKTTSFNCPLTGTALAFISGSCAINNGGTVGIAMTIDGTTVAQTTAYINESNSHHALPPIFVPIQVAWGSHQMGIATTGATTTSANDLFTLGLIY